MKSFVADKPKMGSDIETKVTADYIIEKTENAISRGANDLYVTNLRTRAIYCFTFRDSLNMNYLNEIGIGLMDYWPLTL